MIDRAVVTEDYVLRNLEREARILSAVSHPCILYIYETIQYRSLYCIVTELLPGRDLCDFTKGQPGGRLDERTARRFVRQLASALEHMHSRGIVHRDLKMQNIVVDLEQSLVKIIDFGISNYWSLEGPLSTRCGSPEYAAPELFVAGRKYGPEVDLWSLGVIMFCMSAGCLPFSLSEKDRSLPEEQQRRILVTRIRKGLVQKHQNFLSHYSKGFSDLICGLLETKPSSRFRVEQVLCHPWTTKSPNLLLEIPKNVEINADVNGKLWIFALELRGVKHFQIIMRMCTIVNSMHKDVEKRIRKEPLGPLGGIHRILYHKELKKHWRLLEAFSPLHTLSGSLSSGSLIASHHNQMNLRPSMEKVKPPKVSCSQISQFSTSRDCHNSENTHIRQESRVDSEMDFRQEPWSSNFSSAIMNNRKSLIVTSLRSKNCSYNYRKGQLINSDIEEVLEVRSATEAGVGTVQSDTSSLTSTRTSIIPDSEADGNASAKGVRNKMEHGRQYEDIKETW